MTWYLSNRQHSHSLLSIQGWLSSQCLLCFKSQPLCQQTLWESNKMQVFFWKKWHRIWPQKLDIFVTSNGNKYLLTSFFHCIFLPTVVDRHTSCTFFSPSFLMHYVIRGVGFSFCAASLLREFPPGLLVSTKAGTVCQHEGPCRAMAPEVINKEKVGVCSLEKE